jgi:hypothetical protein
MTEANGKRLVFLLTGMVIILGVLSVAPLPALVGSPGHAGATNGAVFDEAGQITDPFMIDGDVVELKESMQWTGEAPVQMPVFPSIFGPVPFQS